jgi:hypothetical protein
MGSWKNVWESEEGYWMCCIDSCCLLAKPYHVGASGTVAFHCIVLQYL